MNIYGFSPFGYEGALVRIEVDLRRGIPAIEIVGLPGGTVREARERMRAAIRNSGLEFPPERVLINLPPADVRKDGAGFDLPIALGVLTAARREKTEGNVMAVGELELSGTVRSVRGISAAIYSGIEKGVRFFIVPKGNEAEVSGTGGDGVHIYGTDSLLDAFRILLTLPDVTPETAASGVTSVTESRDTTGGRSVLTNDADEDPVFSMSNESDAYAGTAGQGRLVRALQIAAAGGHHLLAYGPPGCGKTLAIGGFPSLLPLLTENEARTITRIYSLAGLPSPWEAGPRRVPFRKPHQNASLQGMTGGGSLCTPGEVSLAHHGALFLDEAAEFRTSVLQALRTPLETGQITLSRAGLSTVYPARFQLLLATNPCPCGNFGSDERVCTCTPQAVEQYWKRFSSPLLDRIDLRVQVRQPDREELIRGQAPSLSSLREGILRALCAQARRQGHKNAQLTPEGIHQYCRPDAKAAALFTDILAGSGISGRAGHSILKTARTIADMEGSQNIEERHISEAAEFRLAGDEPLN